MVGISGFLRDIEVKWGHKGLRMSYANGLQAVLEWFVKASNGLFIINLVDEPEALGGKG